MSRHPAQLGLRDFDPSRVRLVPEPIAGGPSGRLRLLRFEQRLVDPASARWLPIHGSGRSIALELDSQGRVVALSGSIVDTSVDYGSFDDGAARDVAEASALFHVRAHLGAEPPGLVVDDAALMVEPAARAIVWVAHVSAGPGTSMKVVMSRGAANSAGPLELLGSSTGMAYGLDDATPITVRTEDPASDVMALPVEATVDLDAMLDGTPLLGSLLSPPGGDAYLGNEHVYVLDFDGAGLSEVGSILRPHSASGDFVEDWPDDGAYMQMAYYLGLSSYHVVDALVSGGWDSALPYFGLASEFSPGTFAPRLLIAFDSDHSCGGAACASFFQAPADPAVPEATQSAPGGMHNEAQGIVFLGRGLGSTQGAHLFLHEMGHLFDVFLGVGTPKDQVNPCLGATCDSDCDPGTTDEASPLTETIAQMFSIWLFSRLHPSVDHGSCGVLNLVRRSFPLVHAVEHEQACMDPGDTVNLFLFDDDPACPESLHCDRPVGSESDIAYGQHTCDHNGGYQVMSLLQMYWNFLHGQYCDPASPFACEPFVAGGIEWPPGCAADPAVACATDDQIAALPLLYALRTNPLTYEQLIEAMVRFVACNYGETAHQRLAQALCDHHLRGCNAPAPVACEACFDGIRDGTEQCDGDDLSSPVPGHGAVTCVDLGYGGGQLACVACSFDVSGCIDSAGDGALDGTASAGGPSGSEGAGSDPSMETDAAAGGSGSEPTGSARADGDGGGGASGCSCRSSSRSSGGVGYLLLLTSLGWLVRRSSCRVRGWW